MKSKTGIKSRLGLSQDEMAKLTGVTRSQWSMYEIGQRDIPLASTRLLGDLLLYLQKQEGVAKTSATIIETEKKKNKKWLQQEHLAQQHKIELLERKIQVTENIRKDCFAALEVVQYLELFPDNITFAALALDITDRVTISLNNNSLQQLQQLQMKKESAEMLKLKLEEKLKS